MLWFAVMNFFSKAFFLLLLLVALGFINGYAPYETEEDPHAINVLFVGNSLTHYNNLPQIIQDIARSNGYKLRYGTHLIGGSTLQQHANSRELQQKLRSKNWNFVILQEQSQRPAFAEKQVKREVLDNAEKIVNAIRSTNPDSEVMFYMTMARKDGDKINAEATQLYELGSYDGMQRRINNTYLTLAWKNSALVAPVGVVWQYMMTNYSEIPLYTDPVHPNINGSYLAACVLFSTLHQHPCQGSVVPDNIKVSTAQLIQQVSDEIVLRAGNQWDWRQKLP